MRTMFKGFEEHDLPIGSAETMMAGKVPVILHAFRAEKFWWSNDFERSYLDGLIDTIKPGMTVIGIGVENGEFEALAAKLSGGENMHLFEPTKEYWPNIRQLWELNGFPDPKGCFRGFVFDKSSQGFSRDFGWPECCDGDLFAGTNHSVPSSNPSQSISIDDYCELTGTKPNIIMMDCEGFELSIMRGAVNTIRKFSPTVFISVHNDELIELRSSGNKSDLINLMYDSGFTPTLLGKDHEEHWKFSK